MSMLEKVDLDFINRTSKIIEDYNGEYEVTLLINCLYGLLIFPKAAYYIYLKKKKINFKDEEGISLEVDGSKVNCIDAEKFFHSLRNGLSHWYQTDEAKSNVEFIGKSDKIECIKLYGERYEGKENVKVTISNRSMKQFVNKLLEVLKSI